MDDSGTSGVMPVLLQVVEENAGIRLQASDSDASFFELGLDSLFLTQFSVSLAKRFGMSLTFRQLSSEFGNLRKLARFLDDSLPRQGSPSAAGERLTRVEPAQPVREVPRHLPAHHRAGGPPVDSDPLIQLFLRQIDVMQQQLASLSTTVGLAPGDQAAPPARYVEQGNSNVVTPPGATSPATSIPPVAAIVLPPSAEARPASMARSASMATSVSMAASAAEALAAAPPEHTGATDTAARAGAGKVLDAARPPVPGARLGRDPTGQPAWFVPRADQPGKFVKLD